MVLVPHDFGSGPTLLVPLGSVSLVPSIFQPLDLDGWTAIKNANHCIRSLLPTFMNSSIR
jgi:hypothetical protein